MTQTDQTRCSILLFGTVAITYKCCEVEGQPTNFMKLSCVHEFESGTIAIAQKKVSTDTT